MANPKAQRTLDPSKPVEVYWNFHKRCFSLRQRGLVVAHAQTFGLRDVELKVSKAGRERVLRERRKNVHAVLRGWVLRGPTEPEPYLPKPLTYNPYKAGSFMMDDAPADRAKYVVGWVLNDAKPTMFAVPVQ